MSGQPDPFDELEPIDQAALFGPDEDTTHASRTQPSDDDTALLTALFAADLADEPDDARSTEEIVAAARAASGTTDASDASDAVRRSDEVDELAVRRSRRTRVWGRGLLAAAAVAALAIGGVAALRSSGTDTTTSAGTGVADQATVAAGSVDGRRSQAGAGEKAPQSAAAQSSMAGSSAGSTGSDATALTQSGSGASPSRPAVPAATGGNSYSDGGSETTENSSGSTSSSATSAPASVSSASGSSNPDAQGQCTLRPLTGPAFTAASGALSGRSVRSSGAVVAAACGSEVLRARGGTLVVDGIRMSVLVSTDGSLPVLGVQDDLRQEVQVRDGRLLVVVSVPTRSTISDVELRRVAEAVLAALR